MRPLTAALLLASLAGAGAAADGADDDREKPPPLAQVMSIPDLGSSPSASSPSAR